MIFPYFSETFDAQEQKEYTWRFKLLPGESIASATIDQVDITSTTLVVPVAFNFGQKSFGVISGVMWGVTQWLLPMSDGGFTSYLRCVITTDYAGPIPHIYSRTMRLRVGQN